MWIISNDEGVSVNLENASTIKAIVFEDKDIESNENIYIPAISFTFSNGCNSLILKAQSAVKDTYFDANIGAISLHSDIITNMIENKEEYYYIG